MVSFVLVALVAIHSIPTIGASVYRWRPARWPTFPHCDAPSCVACWALSLGGIQETDVEENRQRHAACDPYTGQPRGCAGDAANPPILSSSNLHIRQKVTHDGSLSPKGEMRGSLLDTKFCILAAPSSCVSSVPSDVAERCRDTACLPRLTTHSLRNPNPAGDASACSLFVCVNRYITVNSLQVPSNSCNMSSVQIHASNTTTLVGSHAC